MGRAEGKGLCFWGTARAYVELSFWNRRDFGMATNRHRSVLGCKQGHELGTAPRRLLHTFLLS